MSLFDSASLVVTPNGQKAGKLYSIKPTDGSGDLSVTRATTATRVNSSGLIESVATNVPRLDYTNGTCPSILVEPQRTNLLLRSEEFNDIYWDKVNATITANSSVAPSGNTTADTLVITSGGYLLRNNAPYSAVLGQSVTISIFAKNQITNFLAFGGATTAGTDVYTIQDYGNGWYRHIRTRTFTTTNASANIQYIIFNQIGTHIIWGAQLEAGANATSYIPTTSASVTRNADVISKTGISSLIGQTEGTVFIELDIKNTIANRIPIVISSANPGTSTSEAYFYINPSGNLVFEFYTAGVAQCSISAGAVQVGVQKLAFVYKNNDFAFYRNGTLVGTDTGGTVVSGLDRLFLGCFTNSSLQLNDRIKSATIWKERLSNDQLAQLTTL